MVVVSKESNTLRHWVSVAAVVVDADRVLVVRRRDNGRLEPPGGVLELGESIPDGLRRDVCEETGSTVEPNALTGVYKNVAGLPLPCDRGSARRNRRGRRLPPAALRRAGRLLARPPTPSG